MHTNFSDGFVHCFVPLINFNVLRKFSDSLFRHSTRIFGKFTFILSSIQVPACLCVLQWLQFSGGANYYTV